RVPLVVLPRSWGFMSVRAIAGVGGCAMRRCPMRSGGSWPGRSKPTTSITPPDTRDRPRRAGQKRWVASPGGVARNVSLGGATTTREGVSKLLIWYPLLRTSATSCVGGTMITQVLHCPYCHGTDIVRHGLSPEGKQRYRCRACLEGRGRTFLLEYTYAGQSPEVKQQIVDMALNASGIRDTARVLHVSPTTVIKELKKRNLTCKR